MLKNKKIGKYRDLKGVMVVQIREVVGIILRVRKVAHNKGDGRVDKIAAAILSTRPW